MRWAEVALAVVAFGLGGAAGTPVAKVVYDYQWSDPDFCDDCHVHDYANRAYERSVHAGLTTCHDCHMVPIRHYPWNLYRALFDRPEGPEDIAKPHVESVVCSKCHSAAGADEPLTGPMSEAVRAEVVKIDDSPSHRSHSEAGVACVDCHGTGSAGAAHRFVPTREQCEVCHALPVRDGELGEVGCQDCHGAAFVEAPQADR